MPSALKFARRYKDITSIRLHFEHFSGSESRMQLENAYASKEWQIESVIKKGPNWACNAMILLHCL